MAALREMKSKSGKRWQSVVRKGGFDLFRVFDDKKEAKKWAAQVESAIEVSTESRPFIKDDWLPKKAVKERQTRKDKAHAAIAELPSLEWTVDKALTHYKQTVTIKKAGEMQERNRIALVQRYPIASVKLGEVTPEHIDAFATQREADGATSGTVRLDLYLLSAMFRIACLHGTDRRHRVKGWSLAMTNPVKQVAIPEAGQARDRRLHDALGDGDLSEEERILNQLAQQDHGPEMVDYIRLCIETGMRRGELKKLRKMGVVRNGGVTMLTLPTSKNGKPRRVVVTGEGLAIVMRRIQHLEPMDHVFGLSANQITTLWEKARAAIGSPDLRIHDLRHEGLSRMASKNLHLGELQAQSGHSSVKSLARYLNARPQDIAAKLMG